MWTEFDREFSNQMIKSSFTGVVGFTACFRNHRVCGTGKNHGDGKALFSEYPLGLAGEMIVSGDIHEEGLRPQCVGEFAVGGGYRIDGGRIDDNIDTAKLENREVRSVRKGCS